MGSVAPTTVWPHCCFTRFSPWVLWCEFVRVKPNRGLVFKWGQPCGECNSVGMKYYPCLCWIYLWKDNSMFLCQSAGWLHPQTVDRVSSFTDVQSKRSDNLIRKARSIIGCKKERFYKLLSSVIWTSSRQLTGHCCHTDRYRYDEGPISVGIDMMMAYITMSCD